MLADAEGIEPRLIGEFGRRDDLAIALLHPGGSAGLRIGGDIAESIETQFHARPACPAAFYCPAALAGTLCGGEPARKSTRSSRPPLCLRGKRPETLRNLNRTLLPFSAFDLRRPNGNRCTSSPPPSLSKSC